MIDLSKLKEIVSLMSSNDLAEVSLTQGEEHITIKRGPQGGTVVNHQPVMYGGAGAGPAVALAPAAAHTPAPVQASGVAAPAASEAPAPAKPAAVTNSIDSPMVGTFYSKPNPDAPVFVKPGQSVTPDTVVCIIEAMKVFNEIKAEKAGVIDAMLVKDGQAVEFGTKLFAVR